MVLYSSDKWQILTLFDNIFFIIWNYINNGIFLLYFIDKSWIIGIFIFGLRTFLISLIVCVVTIIFIILIILIVLIVILIFILIVVFVILVIFVVFVVLVILTLWSCVIFVFIFRFWLLFIFATTATFVLITITTFVFIFFLRLWFFLFFRLIVWVSISCWIPVSLLFGNQRSSLLRFIRIVLSPISLKFLNPNNSSSQK